VIVVPAVVAPVSPDKLTLFVAMLWVLAVFSVKVSLIIPDPMLLVVDVALLNGNVQFALEYNVVDVGVN